MLSENLYKMFYIILKLLWFIATETTVVLLIVLTDANITYRIVLFGLVNIFSAIVGYKYIEKIRYAL